MELLKSSNLTIIDYNIILKITYTKQEAVSKDTVDSL